MASRVTSDGPGRDMRRPGAAELQSLRYAEDVRRLYRQLQRAICQSLLGLANALEAKDPYTRGHSERVAWYCAAMARHMGMSEQEVERVHLSGIIHDVGKIGIPETVLRKRGPLDTAEWALMHNHPIIGAQIVAPFEFFGGGALVIRHHHERWNGTGYPDGLAGAAIPLGARIVAVADVFDALTSDRPYRGALSRDVALAHLIGEAGRTLDADVVAALLGLVHLDAGDAA